MYKVLLTILLGVTVGIACFPVIAPAVAVPIANAQTGGTNIVVNTIPHSSVLRGIIDRIGASWPWYIARAAGLVAAILFFILMLSGVGFITGHSFGFLEPITAWATHRALGIALGVAVVLHVVALYFDTFVPFDLKALLVPFASDYQPLYVSLGVFALYIMAAIVTTSLIWVDKKPRTWKTIHLFSYLAFFLIFIHALYLGTDFMHGLLRWLWTGAFWVVTLASLVRLRRFKTV